MTKRKLVVEIIFEEVTEDDDTYLEVTKIRRGKNSNLTAGEMDSLGESVGQSDEWQVDRWIDIQRVLGGTKSVEVSS